MTPRLFVLLILLAIAVIGLICASGTHTVIGLGALSWLFIWLGVFAIDMVLLQEWPNYIRKSPANTT